MSQSIGDFVTPSCQLLAFGEPTHVEPAFPLLRNELFAQLADLGFRSIAIESCRAAGLTVNDFVQEGEGSLDTAMSNGFSHGFGELGASGSNRQLVAWMRSYNEGRPAAQRLAFHGFDAAMEMMSAPSPRRYLEHARDYLKRDLDIASLAGEDERWSRTEAVLDPAESIGATVEADSLRVIADDMLNALYAHAPELIAATSRARWSRARTHLTTGLGLLRYHKQCALRIEDRNARISALAGVRDALMAQNLFDIKEIEAGRGPTLVFAHNSHLQRNSTRWSPARTGMDLNWFSAGAIVASVLGDQYVMIAGSLGSSVALDLGEPEPDTYEGFLQRQTTTWGLTAAGEVGAAATRTGFDPRKGYFPLTQPLLDGADAVLHIGAGAPSQVG